MKVVKVNIELVIPDDLDNKDNIVEYLNDKLWNDPEFFGDFGVENVVEVQEIE